MTSRATKGPPAKKKKKGPNWPLQGSGVPGHLVHLSGLPVDATLQEVADLVGTFGKNTIHLLAPPPEGWNRAMCDRKVRYWISSPKPVTTLTTYRKVLNWVSTPKPVTTLTTDRKDTF